MIQIGAHKISVVWDPTMYKRQELKGVTHYDESRIECANDGFLSVEDKVHTFIHECLHCIDIAYLGQILDERAVDGIAEGLTQMLGQMTDLTELLERTKCL